MIEELPSYVNYVFIATTLLAVYFFFSASYFSKPAIAVILLLMLIQGIVGYSGFFLSTDSIPPRFIFLIGPPVLLIAILFVTRQGKNFIDSLDLKTLTLLHTVRIPVELVLLWLFQSGKVPQLMTFEGRNFDIISGLTAPLVYYFGFFRETLSKKVILVWNMLCLGLLINIVLNAILSAPFPFQQFAFDQPNVGVFYFPFVWLPGIIVPLVLFAHLVAIRRLSKKLQ